MKHMYMPFSIYQKAPLLFPVFFPMFVCCVFCAVSQIVSAVRRLRSPQKRLAIHAPVEVLRARRSETEERRERRAA